MLSILAKSSDFHQSLGKKDIQGRLEWSEHNQLEEKQFKRNIMLGFFLYIQRVKNTPLIFRFPPIPSSRYRGEHVFIQAHFRLSFHLLASIPVDTKEYCLVTVDTVESKLLPGDTSDS